MTSIKTLEMSDRSWLNIANVESDAAMFWKVVTSNSKKKVSVHSLDFAGLRHASFYDDLRIVPKDMACDRASTIAATMLYGKGLLGGLSALCMGMIMPPDLTAADISRIESENTTAVLGLVSDDPKLSKQAKSIADHYQYLREVSSDHPDAPISRETATRARKAWNELWESSGCTLPVPAACTGPDGQMYYSWDEGRHHLELEIIPGQPAEFFYRDRDTGDFFGEDHEIGSPLPVAILQKLKHFA